MVSLRSLSSLEGVLCSYIYFNQSRTLLLLAFYFSQTVRDQGRRVAGRAFAPVAEVGGQDGSLVCWGGWASVLPCKYRH